MRLIILTITFCLSIISCKTNKIEIERLSSEKNELVIKNKALTDSISKLKRQKYDSPKCIISIDEFNTVYRGILNPITIVVPNSKSIEVISEAVRIDDITQGKFSISPGAGDELTIKIIVQMHDGSVFTENKTFRIKPLKSPLTYFNNETSQILYLNKEEIINGYLELKMPDFAYNVNYEIINFAIELPFKKHTLIEGNKFDENSIKLLDKLKKGDEIIIKAIKAKISDGILKPLCLIPNPIIISYQK